MKSYYIVLIVAAVFIASFFIGYAVRVWRRRLKESDDDKLNRRAAFGAAEAQYLLGKKIYDKTKAENKWLPYEDAVGWFLKAAKKGHSLAQFELGNCYAGGKGVLTDYTVAVEWWEKAAQNGVDEAYLKLGKLFWRGNYCTEKDQVRAEGYFLPIAERGNAEAQFALGHIYWLVPELKDKSKSDYWFKKSAESGNASAQEIIGHGYTFGKNRDEAKAEYWLLKSAEQGNETAQGILGKLYLESKDALRDFDKAVYWLKKAAESNDAAGQFYLGRCYKEGCGVDRNYEKAFSFFKKAAKKGDRFNDYADDARYEMALLYIDGLGVEKDIDKAEKLLKQAIKGYVKGAQEAYDKYFGHDKGAL